MENNKLIAEFMEVTKVFKPKDLAYHNSYAWLMPVVEKIESLGYPTVIKCIGIGQRLTVVLDGGELFEGEICTTKIEATYKAVVEFINWYNKQ